MHVTPRAKEELHDMLLRAIAVRARPGPDGAPRPSEQDARLAFRILPSTRGPEDSGLGLTLDAPHPGDERVEHGGRFVLVLDRSVASHLSQLTLDLVETPEGSRLGLLA
ncbi:MAG: hypothetical protein ACQGVC_03365 [Myxococcota bacterium]